MQRCIDQLDSHPREQRRQHSILSSSPAGSLLHLPIARNILGRGCFVLSFNFALYFLYRACLRLASIAVLPKGGRLVPVVLMMFTKSQSARNQNTYWSINPACIQLWVLRTPALASTWQLSYACMCCCGRAGKNQLESNSNFLSNMVVVCRELSTYAALFVASFLLIPLQFYLTRRSTDNLLFP